MKKKILRRVLACFLCLAAVLCSGGLKTYAAEDDVTYRKIVYRVTKEAEGDEYGEVEVRGVRGSYNESILDIPADISAGGKSYYVTSIGDLAFYKSDFSSVWLPDTIRSIGAGSFASCRSLEGVAIPKECVSIGDEAFLMCTSLSALEFYDKCELSVIGSASFAYTPLTELKLPDSVDVVEKSAFFMCSKLKDIYVGVNVDTIGPGAFSGCSAIESFKVAPDSSFLKDRDNIIYTRDGKKLVSAPAAAGDIEILKSVRTIEDFAFEYADKLTAVRLPDNVEKIGRGAFFECSSLESVENGKGLKTIEDKAFYGCKSLKNISLGNRLKTIGTAAFQGCEGLEAVFIPASVKDIEGNVFSYCTSLSGLEVDSANKNYCSEAGMLMTSTKKTLISYPSAAGRVTVPSTVKNVGAWAFQGCKNLKEAIIPAGVKKVQEGAFYDCEALSLVRLGSLGTGFPDAAAADEGDMTGSVFYGTRDDMLIEIPSGSGESVEIIRESLLAHCSGRVFIVTY